MKNTITLALCAAALLLGTACNKNYSTTPAISTSGLNALFSDLRPAAQSFTVSAGTSATVTGSNGTVMHFYANSFKDKNGNPITSGTVNLQLTEMYKPGAMISCRASTICNGAPLQSGGQICLQASINGQQVYANKFGVEFTQPAASAATMNLFYGNTANADSITTWNIGADSGNLGATSWGTSGLIYIFDSCSHFGFINCDHFYQNDSPMVSVNVVLPDNTFNPSNTQIYLVLPDITSVMSNDGSGTCYDAKSITMLLTSESQTKIVPTGLNYKFVVLSKKNGNYYYFQTSGVTAQNIKFTASMSSKTHDQVTALLDSL